MRKLLLFNLLFFAVSSFAQVPKTILVEHFTNTYCGICANRNPGLFTNLANFPKALHLSYHPSSPYKQCPLNQYNKDGNDDRANHYSVYGSTPRVVANGVALPPQTNYSSTQFIDDVKAEMSDYSLEVSWSQIGPTDSIRINVTIKLESSNSQTEGEIYIGLFQDTVFMESKNGEKNPPNVFRGGTNGHVMLTLPTVVGNSESIEVVLAPLSDLDGSSLYAAAILYNDMDEYQQAARSSSHTTLPTLLLDQNENTFTIYPNPSQGAIYHSADTDLVVRIVDLSGKSHYEGIWKNSEALPRKLETGVYLVQVELNGMFKTSRLHIYP